MACPFFFGFLASFRCFGAANRMIGMYQNFIGPVFQRKT